MENLPPSAFILPTLPRPTLTAHTGPQIFLTSHFLPFIAAFRLNSLAS